MRSSRGKARRRQEQDAVDAVYTLCEFNSRRGGVAPAPDGILADDYDGLWSFLQQFDRRFRCPRCGGHGDDPEQPNQSWPPTDPPDPCGLCSGYGTINRAGLDTRIDRVIDHAREAYGDEPWDV